MVDGGNTVKSGRVKVSMSVTPEPHLEGIRKQHHDSIVQYMAGETMFVQLQYTKYMTLGREWKSNRAFALMIGENHEKTPVRLFGTGILTRDLPNASLVRYQGATSLV